MKLVTEKKSELLSNFFFFLISKCSFISSFLFSFYFRNNEALGHSEGRMRSDKNQSVRAFSLDQLIQLIKHVLHF